MAIQFPANPSNGQSFTASNNLVYVYDGEKWITTGSAEANGNFVLKTGSNMTGDLTLGTDKIVLDAGDGSASFADSIQVGGNPRDSAGVEPGVIIQESNTKSIFATGADKIAISVKTTGITGPKTVIFGGGSATFGGDVTVPNLIATDDIQSTSQNGGQLAGFRNQLINGDFRINQRGIIGPVAAYTADRWRPNTAPTQLHWKTINPGTNIPFSKYLGVTSSSTQSIVAQLIELPDPGAWGPFESGSTWTLSWYTQQNLTDIDIYVDFVDSSAGTNSQPCTVGTPQLIESGAWGSSFSRYSVEVTITGSIAATNAALRLYYVGSNSKAFDLARVQLEPGPVATPFEHRPITTELALCQRYYQKAARIRLYAGSADAELLT